MKKLLVLPLMLFLALTLTDCRKNDKLSSEEKMLVGTWRKYDNYCAAYGGGWTSKLVLNSDHTCLFDYWWTCDGSSIEHTSGTWSYNASNNTLTYNTISDDVDSRPYNETQLIVSLSKTNMTLSYFDGGIEYWTKQ